MEAVEIVILRTYEKNVTTSEILFNNELIGYGIELPYQGNRPFVSSIPEGTYFGKLYKSPKHGWCIAFEQVRDRQNIQIHVGNKITETTGCILVGESLDRKYNLYNSRKVLTKLINNIQSLIVNKADKKIKIKVYEKLDFKSNQTNCD